MILHICWKHQRHMVRELRKNERFVIGSGSLVDVCVQDDMVSRSHCLVERDCRERCTIFDLHSLNGTYVNGKEVAYARKLCDGDLIQIGNIVIMCIDPRVQKHYPVHGT